MHKGWIPIRFGWEEESPIVDWCLLGDRRLTGPFFESTIQDHLQHPFHHAFRRQTPIDALGEWAARSPGIPPSGFIFHQSRCGSTLICRMFSALDRNVVLSEPPPADAVLRAHFGRHGITDEQRAKWFRWIVSALGQPRSGSEDRLFLKFDAWSIAELPIIRRAFPHTPWIFLYREPIEVLVSQMHNRAPFTVPGMLQPAVLGLDAADLAGIPPDEYCARVLARICHLGLHHLRCGGLLVNYRQLPEFAWIGLAHHFGLGFTDPEVERMRAASESNAKTPGLPFLSDSHDKRESADERQRELAARWMAPVYREMEAATLQVAETAS